MDDHQRRVWGRMITVLDDFDAGVIDLSTLCSQLKGLLGASDIHGEALIREFWDHFLQIDMELELRTESWAAPGAASDHRLRAALTHYRRWVEATLAAPSNVRR